MGQVHVPWQVLPVLSSGPANAAVVGGVRPWEELLWVLVLVHFVGGGYNQALSPLTCSDIVFHVSSEFYAVLTQHEQLNTSHVMIV